MLKEARAQIAALLAKLDADPTLSSASAVGLQEALYIIDGVTREMFTVGEGLLCTLTPTAVSALGGPSLNPQSVSPGVTFMAPSYSESLLLQRDCPDMPPPLYRPPTIHITLDSETKRAARRFYARYGSL